MQATELDQARGLMESAEREVDPVRKFADLQEGLDLIDDFLDTHPEASHLQDIAINRLSLVSCG